MDPRIILSLFLTGILFGSGPCMASCGPVFVCYLFANKTDTLRPFISYVFFVLSRIAAYLILSIIAFYLGNFGLQMAMGRWYWLIAMLGSAFIMMIGFLLLAGQSAVLPWVSILQERLLRKGVTNLSAIGFVIGLMPCAPLFALFAYIGMISRSWLHTMVLTLIFGAGTFFSPLLIAVFFAQPLQKRMFTTRLIIRKSFNVACALVIILFGASLLRRVF